MIIFRYFYSNIGSLVYLILNNFKVTVQQGYTRDSHTVCISDGEHHGQ